MASILSETSNYILSILLAVYVLLNFYLLFRKSDKKTSIYLVQNLLLCGMHTIAYVTLFYRSSDVRYFFFYAFQEILLFGLLIVYRIIYRKANRFLLNNTLLLLMLGFTILSRLNIQNAIRQFVISYIILIFVTVLPWLLTKLTHYKKYPWLYAGVGVLLLGTVLLTGTVTNGSKLAFDLGFCSFQPSEFVKITIVIFIALMLKDKQDIKTVLLAGVAIFAHMLLLVLSKDLGSAAIFFVAYVFMVYVATNKTRYIAIFTSLGGVAAFAAYKMFSHVRVRFQTWLDPWKDMDKKGYQLTQSLFAIGTGGWFGMGLFQGAPATIPYVNKDFIFSAIAEEMGTVFALLLLAVFVSLFLMILISASKMENDFSRLVYSGFGTIIIFQVLLTVGGGTRFIPLTGVTLPLISTGGSSAAATILMFGIMQALLINESQVTISKEDESNETDH